MTAARKTQAPRTSPARSSSMLSVLLFCCTYMYLYRYIPHVEQHFQNPHRSWHRLIDSSCCHSAENCCHCCHSSGRRPARWRYHCSRPDRPIIVSINLIHSDRYCKRGHRISLLSVGRCQRWQHLAARWQQLLPMSKAFLRLRSASPSRYKDFTNSCAAVRETQAPRFPVGGQSPVLSVLLFCCTYNYIHRSLPVYQPVFPESSSFRAISYWQQLLPFCCNLLPLLPTSGALSGPVTSHPPTPSAVVS